MDERAIVEIIEQGSRGVVVKGGIILTAAHCIKWNGEGYMALGDYFIEEIKTHDGVIKAAPLCVEPISDIAVLGPLDYQEFTEEADAFEAFCESVNALDIFMDDMVVFEKIPGKTFGLDRKWHTVQIQSCKPRSHMVWVEHEEVIECGCSGGPILNAAKARMRPVWYGFPSSRRNLKGKCYV